jgi:hypothetical protein
MILVAAGDSFIWGSELADSQQCHNGYSKKTFPALLAQQANMNYACAAYPGNANNAISRMAIDMLSDIQGEKFLLVEWTYPQRYEFRINDEWVSVNSWHTAATEFSEHYFKHAGDSEYFELYSILKEIVFLQHYCQLNNVPYMFMTADNHFFQHENYIRRQDAGLDNLYNQIDWDKWFWFAAGIQQNEICAPRGFCQWAVENKYKVGVQLHPLEGAHRAAAFLIKEKFDELVAKHN